MKRLDFAWQWALWLLLLGNVWNVSAQETQGFVREQRIYDLFVAGQGDSLHTALCPDFQKKFTPVALSGLYRQLEQQFGKLQSAGEWHTDTVQHFALSYRDMQFEKFKLRFALAFDGEGKVNSLTVTPAPAATTAQPVAYDKEKMEEREVTVETDGFQLPGTLTLPKKAVADGANRKVPCVVLVHGSGPNDRDETVGPNKPFRDLAWGLAERGIAVLRYDKRTKVYGAGCVPAGRALDYDVETVDDALSAVKLARSFREICPDSVYVLGHSLGGLLAPRIAERSEGLAGIVILAGPARRLGDLLVEQYTYLTSMPGAPAEALQQVEEIKQQVANVKLLGTDAFDEQIPLPLKLPRSYWEFDRNYKPVAVALRLKQRILILQGERDYQVTMEDFGLWRFGLWRCKNASFKSYPKLNHLLQEGSGKSTPFEYNRPSPVPAYVMDDIASFVF